MNNTETSPKPGDVIADPETEDTHYGIAIVHVGEDGDMLALGHHGKRKALAAFNKHARTFVGLPNVADDFSARAADWLAAITPRWAVFSVPDPELGHDPDWCWAVRYSDEPVPDARPIMHLSGHAGCHPSRTCAAEGVR